MPAGRTPPVQDSAVSRHALALSTADMISANRTCQRAFPDQRLYRARQALKALIERQLLDQHRTLTICLVHPRIDAPPSSIRSGAWTSPTTIAAITPGRPAGNLQGKAHALNRSRCRLQAGIVPNFLGPKRRAGEIGVRDEQQTEAEPQARIPRSGYGIRPGCLRSSFTVPGWAAYWSGSSTGLRSAQLSQTCYHVTPLADAVTCLQLLDFETHLRLSPLVRC